MVVVDIKDACVLDTDSETGDRALGLPNGEIVVLKNMDSALCEGMTKAFANAESDNEADLEAVLQGVRIWSPGASAIYVKTPPSEPVILSQGNLVVSVEEADKLGWHFCCQVFATGLRFFRDIVYCAYLPTRGIWLRWS